ncbi:FUSC family protein [Bengtsoniella intestinalis]|uniref:FUSC family protein n=1 Tax=Bengtsoniella intestinalis TaxID=3073143 RepID=UPI00391F0F38
MNHYKFPFYFHIGLIFLIINNQGGGVEVATDIVKWGLLLTVILLVCTGMKLHKKGVPFHSADGIAQSTMCKYKTFFKENSGIIQRTLAHCLIIFVICWVGYFVYDHRGYWLIISASAVLIGGDYGRISMRGHRRMIGALISMVVLGGLVFWDANTVVLIAVAVTTMLGIGFFMPNKYIMGSACIGMHATVGNILASGDLSYTIVGQRVLWTILGAILTLVLCYVCDKLLPTLYQDYTKEKLIVAKK